MQFDWKKTLVAAIIFVACIAIGFGVTSLIKGCNEEENMDYDYPSIEEKDSDSVETSISSTIISAADPKEEESITEVEAPQEPEEHDTVYFESHKHRKTVRDTVMNITYRVRYRGTVKEGVVDAQPTDSTVTKREYVNPKPKPVAVQPLMNKSEMKQMLKSGYLAGDDKIAPGFSIVVQGQKSGEEKTVESPADVRDKIRFGIWQDITVIRMITDSKGRISVVHISPVY